MKGLLDSALHRVQELFENGGKPTGVQTGFHKLDDMINGLQPSDLVIRGWPTLDGKDRFRYEYCSLCSDKTTCSSCYLRYGNAQRADCNEDACLPRSCRPKKNQHRESAAATGRA